jgi:hypothetical protein
LVWNGKTTTNKTVFAIHSEMNTMIRQVKTKLGLKPSFSDLIN